MPEFRKDIILDEWVIIATERARRPEYFREKKIRVKKETDEVCPFDGGNESMTPPEIIRVDVNGNVINKKDNNWLYRIVPNKYPALFPTASPQSNNQGIYVTMDGYGCHEVIIHSPEHIVSLNDLSIQQLETLLGLYRRRIRDITGDKRIESIIVMLNQGKEAGASLEHSHSQVFALPLIPPVIQREIDGTRKYFELYEKCPWCAAIKFERIENKRIVYENEHFIITQPFASRSPFETWIMPKVHNTNFEYSTDEEIVSLSHCLKKVLDFFYNELYDPPFNYYIHTGPVNTPDVFNQYHWNFEFIPKMNVKAGFEIAAGIDINVTTPEYTAEYMKKSRYIKK
jgi:UDPglucose--hexose-1-phosphate uridylyltransferase